MALERSGAFSWDAYRAITCNDTSSRPTPELVEAQARVVRKKAPIFGNWAAWNELQCQGWDTVAGDLWLSGPRRPPSPIMIVGTTGDTVVPYVAVTQLRSGFPGSALVTYEGGSHTAYGSGVRCVNQAVEAYLLDRKVPTAEVVCPAVGAKSLRASPSSSRTPSARKAARPSPSPSCRRSPRA
ncbi:alpha/beta hydrolase [Nonomuraea solani]